MFRGDHILELVESRIPQISQGQALVEVSFCGISNLDLAICSGDNLQVQPPRILGQDICGTVKETRGGPRRICSGAKVIVNPILHCGYCRQCACGQTNRCEHRRVIGLDLDGGFSELVMVPVESLRCVSEDADLECYALAFSMAKAQHAISRIDFNDVNYAVITGSGPIGLLCGLALSRRKDVRVVMVETNRFRLNLARNLGMFCTNYSEGHVQNLIMRHCPADKDGPDVVIETSGNLALLDLALKVVRVRGQVVVYRDVTGRDSVDFVSLYEKEISLLGTSMYSDEDLFLSISEISGKEREYKPLISHRLPLEAVAEGIKILENVEETMKVLVSPLALTQMNSPQKESYTGPRTSP